MVKLPLFLRYASSRSQPPIDSQQDIFNASVSVMESRTVVTFYRMRVSSDAKDLDLDQAVYVLYAYGGVIMSLDPVSISRHDVRGLFSNETITLSSGDTCPASMFVITNNAEYTYYPFDVKFFIFIYVCLCLFIYMYIQYMIRYRRINLYVYTHMYVCTCILRRTHLISLLQFQIKLAMSVWRGV